MQNDLICKEYDDYVFYWYLDGTGYGTLSIIECVTDDEVKLINSLMNTFSREEVHHFEIYSLYDYLEEKIYGNGIEGIISEFKEIVEHYNISLDQPAIGENGYKYDNEVEEEYEDEEDSEEYGYLDLSKGNDRDFYNFIVNSYNQLSACKLDKKENNSYNDFFTIEYYRENKEFFKRLLLDGFIDDSSWGGRSIDLIEGVESQLYYLEEMAFESDLVNLSPNGTVLDKDCEYYVGEDNCIYRRNLRCGCTEKLTDSGCYNLVGDENFLYYVNKNDNSSIYRLKKDGRFNEKLNNNKSLFINVYNGWIFYSNYSDFSRLYKLKIDGTEDAIVCSDSVAYIKIDNNWIYYWNRSDSGNIYRIRINGTEAMNISDCADKEIRYDAKYFEGINEGWFYSC